MLRRKVYIAYEAMLKGNYVKDRICIELQTMHRKRTSEHSSAYRKKRGN